MDPVRPESIRLYLFGQFRVLVGEPPEERKIGTLHGRRLLAFLALQPHTSLPRAQVAGTLFPDMPEERARRALSQAIWRVRKVLGPHIFAGNYDENIALGPHVWVDTQAFRRLSQSQALEDWLQALELYTGDFWPESYEDWVLVGRERLREMYLALLDKVSTHYKRLGQYEMALRYARESVHHEPLREHAHREIIHLYLLLDRPLEALRQYETLRALLREEFGIEPSAELQALRHRIEARVKQSQAPAVAPLFSGEGQIPFVGRHAEREHLLRAIEQALRGQGGFVFVEGIPGMGKSRLLKEAAEDARWRGMLVGYSQAIPQDPGPFAVLRESVNAVLTPTCVATLQRSLPATLVQTAAHLWPPLGPLAPNVHPRQMRNAIVHTILTLSRCAPILLLLDDIHNTTPDTLDILQDLCPDIHSAPLLIVLAYRAPEMRYQNDLWEALLALDRRGKPIHITLEALNESDKRLLISAALNIQVQDPIIQPLVESTDRVPLYIMETLRYLHRRGILQRTTTGAWELTRSDLPLPPSIPSLVRARLERLPQRLRQVVQFLSVLGERMPCTLAAQILPKQSLQVLNDLSRYGFLTVEEQECRFVHALVQEAVYESVPPEQRKMLHQQAAELLRQQQPPPWDQIAYHLQHANRPKAAAQAHLQAAQAARRLYAHNQILRHCDAALSLIEGLDPVVLDLWLLRAEAHHFSGHTSQAREDVARAIYLARCLGDTKRLAEALLLAGKIAIRNARFSQAQRLLKRAHVLYEKRGDAKGMAETALALSDVADTRGNLIEAQTHIEHAIQLVETHDLGEQRVRVLARAGMIAAHLGHTRDAERYYREGAELAEQLGDLYIQGICVNGLGLLYLEQRQHRQAEDRLREALAIAHQLADRHNESVTWLNLAVAAANAGRFTKGYSLCQKSLELTEHVGNERTHMLALLLLGAIQIEWGDFRQAHEHLLDAQRIAQEKGYRAGEGYVLRNLGIWAREQDRLDDAIRWGEEGLQFFYTHQMLEKVPVAAYALGQTLLLAQEFDRAVAVLREGLAQHLSPPMRAFLTAALAWALAALGHNEEADKALEQCLVQLEHVEEDSNLPHAWYHVYRAMSLRAPEKAVPLLRKAYLTLQRQCRNVPEERHHDFLHRVLSHRLISQAWLTIPSRPVERLRLLLPRRDGRGQVHVIWTVDAGDEDALIEAEHGPSALRRHRLLRLLREAEEQNARPTHEALAQALNVSVPTIRRDLRALGKR